MRVSDVRFESLPLRMMSEEERIEAAVELAHSYGQVDGSHHKMWVIDQMLHALLGEDYDAWVAEYEMPESDEDGDYYKWDRGIAH